MSGDRGPSVMALGWDIWRASRDPDRVAARQRARLGRLVALARRRSVFYAERYRELPPHVSDLARLPPLTKRELMARFDDWVSDPEVTLDDVRRFVADPSRVGDRYRGRYLVWTTSGVTGEPAILLHDEDALDVYAALGAVRGYRSLFESGGLLRSAWRLAREPRFAAVFATGAHYFGASFAEHWRRRSGGASSPLRVFSTQAPLADVVHALNEYRPTILVGYATALLFLAAEQDEGRLTIRPEWLVSVAETLGAAGRERIEAAFDAPVHEAYAASEAGLIAFDCGARSLHVNADWLIVEPVDASYRPVRPGTPSTTTLVTNLANRIQPVIRYDIGDSVTFRDGPCPCGNALPAMRVEGRSGDLLSFAGDVGLVRVLPLALVTVVQQTPGVRRFQLIQTAPHRLVVRLECSAGHARADVWRRVRDGLRRYLASQGVSDVALGLASERPSRDARTGKFRQVYAIASEGREVASAAR